MNRSPSFLKSIKHKSTLNYFAPFPLTFTLMYKLYLAMSHSLKILLVALSSEFSHSRFSSSADYQHKMDHLD